MLLSHQQEASSWSYLAQLEVTNLIGRLKWDRRFVQPPSAFCLQTLNFTLHVVCGFSTRWVREINSEHLGNFPCAVPGYEKYFQLDLQTISCCSRILLSSSLGVIAAAVNCRLSSASRPQIVLLALRGRGGPRVWFQTCSCSLETSAGPKLLL